jgi:hypothetical protein
MHLHFLGSKSGASWVRHCRIALPMLRILDEFLLSIFVCPILSDDDYAMPSRPWKAPAGKSARSFKFLSSLREMDGMHRVA